MRSVRLIRLVLLAAILLAWHFAGKISTSFQFGASSPLAVFDALWQMLQKDLLVHSAITAGEAFSGLVAGSVLGTAVGLVLWFAPTLSRALLPAVTLLANFPLFAIAPILIIWFGVGFSLKFALAALGTFFLSIGQAFYGASSVATDHVATLRALGASRLQIFQKLIVPASMDTVLAGLRVSVGVSLLGAFIGEFIAAQQGLGYVILRSSSLFQISKSIAAAFMVGLLAVLFDWFARILLRHRTRLVQILSVPRILR